MNILTVLHKEIEKGNTHITSDGTIINVTKLDKQIKKYYLEELKKGNCSDVTFDQFKINYIDEHYTSLNRVISGIELDINADDEIINNDVLPDEVPETEADTALETDNEPIDDKYITY